MSTKPPSPEPAAIGRWVVDGVLGEGGQATVLSVRADGVRGAARPLGPRLARVAPTLASVRHRGVAGVREVVEAPPAGWLVTEVVPGPALTSLVRRPAVGADRLLSLAVDLVDAVRALHAAGIAHRDLRPDNVLLDDERRPVLVDLGAASLLDDPEPLTAPGQRPPGTPAYAPPEWFGGGAEDPALHDAYGVGVVLYELALGARAPAAPREAPLDPGPPVDEAVRAVIRSLTAPLAAARMDLATAAARLGALRALDPTRAPAAAPPPRIAGFRVLGELGRGGMGVVWRAVSDGGEEVALKVLQVGADPARLAREAELVGRLEHEAIVPLLGVREAEAGPVRVLGLVDGPTRADRLRAGPLAVGQAAAICASVARGLAHAHARGVVHRDVKPSNVLLAPDGRALLTDFGVAAAGDAHTRLTGTGQLVGTAAYMAPEQLSGQHGPRADVYALGAVLYECLAGRPPFRAGGPAELVREVLFAPLPLAPVRAISEDAARVCARALARDPGDRYPDAATMAADLDRLARGDRVSASWRLSRPARRSVGAAVVAAIALGAAGLWAMERRDTAEAVADRHLEALLARASSLAEAGRIDELEAAFASFDAVAAHHDTRARARAWLSLAALRTEPDGRIAAAAEAWVTATDEVERDAALRWLAEEFHARRDWPRLADVLGRGSTAPADDPLARDLALARRDLEALPGDPATAAVASLLRHATRTPWSHTQDLLPSAPGQILLSPVDAPSARLVAAEPGLPLRQLCPGLPDTRSWFPAGLDPTSGASLAIVASGYEGEQALVRCDGGPLVRWRGAPVRDVAVGADGVAYLGVTAYDRELLSLTPDPSAGGGWRLDHPDPATDALSSDVDAVLVADLDLDGAEELILGVGPWLAYDLRVLAREGSAWTLLDRRTSGYVVDLATLPRPQGGVWLAALHVDRYANRARFPAPPHLGPPQGVVLLALRDGRLVEEGVLDVPDPQCRRLVPADVDGDGRVDLGLQCPDASLLYHQGPSGAFAARQLVGLRLVGAADLDGDGDDELIADDLAGGGETWALGAGTERLPPIPVEPLRPLPPPPDADGSLAALWSRAENLAAWQLGSAAEQELAAVAALADGAVAGAALLRAGELAQAEGRDEDALRRYDEARSEPAVAELAAERAVDLLMDAQRYDEALAIARGAGDARSWVVLREALGRLVDRPVVRLDPLDDGWEILDPTALRVRDGRLLLRAGPEPVARRRVRWDGGPLRAVVDARGVDLEPAAQLAWVLEREDLMASDDAAPVGLGVRIASLGGSGVLAWRPQCVVGSPWPPAAPRESRLGPDLPLDAALRTSSWRLSLLVPEEPRDARCRLTWGGGQSVGDFRSFHLTSDPDAAPGEADLVLRGGGFGRSGWASMELVEVAYEGVSPVPAPPADALGAAALALTRSRPQRALELLGDSPPGGAGWALRAIALADLLRTADAREAFARALRDPAPPPDAWVRGLLRAHPGELEPALVSARGDAALDLLHDTWANLLGARLDPPDPALDRFLVVGLEGVTIGPPGPGGATGERVLLLTQRAGALLRAGRPAEARADADAAYALVADDPSPGGRRLAGEVGELQARLALAAGDRAVAEERLERSLAVDPTAEIRREILASDPELAELLSR